MKKLPGISGFLLAYNEEENIQKAVIALLKGLSGVAIKQEVLVVLYERSTDRTGALVTGMAKKDKRIHLVIQKKTRAGYGNAIRIGIEESRYPYVFFSDADNQFDMGDITRLTRHIHQYAIVTGKRKDRKDPLLRIIIAKTYNLVLKILFQLPVNDVDCAFKLYRKSIFTDMKLVCKSGMVNAEIIAKAAAKGLPIKEVPVPHFRRFAGRPVFETGRWAMIKPKVVIDLLKEMKVLWKDLEKP